jgi:hypothetical protein
MTLQHVIPIFKLSFYDKNEKYFDHGSDGELGAQVESDDVNIQHLPPLIDGSYVEKKLENKNVSCYFVLKCVSRIWAN